MCNFPKQTVSLVGGLQHFLLFHMYTKTFQGVTFCDPYQVLFKGSRFDTP